MIQVYFHATKSMKTIVAANASSSSALLQYHHNSNKNHHNQSTLFHELDVGIMLLDWWMHCVCKWTAAEPCQLASLFTIAVKSTHSFICVCVVDASSRPTEKLQKIKDILYSGKSTSSKALFVENMISKNFLLSGSHSKCQVHFFFIIFTIKKITPSNRDILHFLFVCYRKMCGSIILNVHY